ncbi:nitroreductase family protein [Oceanobacillus saliphilus]|uniref:nitroreductase family protein n=1 Tax=Oceanobacillus saliphilus TaxID=2925834 RepID=UPI00201E3ADE|nr:nitroreductase [Oceanobacillus saliphilus]
MKKSELARVIRERRSIKKGYNNQEVTEEKVLELLEDAIWAPNHGMRQPWRFIFVGAEQKASFAKKVAATYPLEKQKNREDYLNEPSAILVVIMEEPDISKQWEENYGATSSLIQNFWLLAWEKRLGVVWKTNPHIYDPKVKELLEVGEKEKIIGFLHLGYFDEQPEVKERISAKDKFTLFKA